MLLESFWYKETTPSSAKPVPTPVSFTGRYGICFHFVGSGKPVVKLIPP